MTAHTTTRCLFEQFAILGGKHAFLLRSGHAFLGWVLEVGEYELMAEWSPSPISTQSSTDDLLAPEDTIRFEDIDLDSLSYWDETAQGWIDFPRSPCVARDNNS